jgi:tetratricopeptide (TPR) repeat protein
MVVRPIGLPKYLKENGHSEEMAAHRLWDEIKRISNHPATLKRVKGLQLAPDQNSPSIRDFSTPQSSPDLKYLPSGQRSLDVEVPGERVEVTIPGAGVSLSSIATIIGGLIGVKKSWIEGELICSVPKCDAGGMSLHLRIVGGDQVAMIYEPPIEKATLDEVYRNSALAVLRELDPYVVAFYLYQTDKAAARREALRLIGPTHPQRKWAFNLLGFIAADSGDYDGAIGWYKRAIAADEEDKFAIAYTNWGNALYSMGDLDGAITKYMRAIEIDPEDAVAYFNWGNALSDKGDLDGMIAKYARATQLDPKDALAYNSWGNALYNKGDLDGAIAKYMRAIELDRENALAYFNWGIALDDKGDPDGAIAKYMRATELDPEYAAAYIGWGIALYRTGDLDGAIAKYMRATELDPENAFAYNKWGSVLGAKRDLDGAFAKFLRATELDPEYANAHFNKALALQMLSRAGDAADAFQRYLDLKPDAGNAEQIRAQIEQLRP